MKISKRIYTLLALSIIVFAGIAATRPFPGKNLKVLPKNISDEQLDKVMESFNSSLGVKCDFCHMKSKDDETKLIFESDEKPEKEIARMMIAMTNKINKEFFLGKHIVGDTSAVMAVTCVTCHRGTPRPETQPEETEP